ncbi:hypothetical protein [Treponema putidum]|uniref:Uncharacterized protein n=1 Tax=Treponema putidum TaxID=221027 RepID=A0AAE9MST1_9SPIR|nr:hypothetical protein [Treponema putidum]TWI79597.1 hypothetical protein JM98_00027 [Treponema putidum]UTY28086.1 hypothetical protein E4N76_03160 [Treponema putidum]UTY30585.1 hypothetical protein E4N75_02760 [Treponema putidum]UTY32992.1 hypothetical protein E4N74_02455 [Treponema putidum]
MNDLLKFLSEGYPILLFVKLFLGAAAVFFGIIVWSKTKKVSMILFVLGVFLMYISILTDTLVYFGFINTNFFTIGRIPLLSLVLESVPIIFFIAGFCAFLRERIF